MVQVLPAVQKKPTFMQKLAGGLSEGLNSALEEYGKYQKKKDYAQALQGVEDIYGDPNLSEQQKLIKSYQLMGQFPEAANQLAGPLSRIGMQQQKSYADRLKGQQEQQQKSYADRLKGQQEQQQTAQAFQNIQDIYNNPDLSDEQKTFGVYKELSQNPTLAHNLLGSIQQQNKAKGQDVAGKQFSKGYNAIVGESNEDLREVLEDPKTPLNVKQKLTDLWDSRQIRKDVAGRELRNRQSLVARSYQQAINSEQSRLKGESLKPSERKAIKEKVSRLQKALRKDIQKLTKDPNSYTDLTLWNELDPEFLPSGADEEGFEGGERGMGGEPAKVAFDPNNQEHRTRAQELFKQYKDKEKVRQILSREFEGL
jgi:hypothetical protein